MKSKIFAVATFAFAMAFAVSAGAVGASEIYTPASGFLKVGSGMGTMAYQAPNVVAAQKALNECNANNHFTSSPVLNLDGKFGALTKGYFVSFQLSQNIAGDGVIGPVTAGKLAACSGTSTPTTPTTSTTLSGGAGDATITTTSTDVEDSLKEDESDVNILGFEVEADGSDINVSSVKVSFKNTSYASSSEKLSDYLDSVSIMMGDEEVGSEDVSDFSKDSGTPDEFSKTISLSNAVVKEDKKVKFYVAVSAVSTIDSDDITNADWDVQVDTIRFNDATGAILSGDVDDLEYADNDAFTFEDSNVDDNIDIKSVSSNPDAATLLVEDNANSDEFLVGSFKLDVDEDSSDITIYELPVVLDFSPSGNTTDDANADSTEDIVDKVRIKVGSTWYDASFDASTGSNGNVTGTYLVEDEFTVDAGDEPVVGIYVTFKDQEDNYGSGAKFEASVTGSAIDAEGEDDVTVGGAFTSEEHTLALVVAEVTVKTATIDKNDAGDAGTISFEITVDNSDGTDDFTFDVADNNDVDGTSDGVAFTLSGTDTTIATAGFTLVSDSNDADYTGSTWTIASGDSATFALDTSFVTAGSGDNGTYRVRIDSVGGVTVNKISGGMSLTY